MAKVIEKAVADRQRALKDDLIVVIDGLRIRVSRSDTFRTIEAARRRNGTHNESRPYVARRIMDLLVARYKSAAVRAFRDRKSSDARTDNVTSLFERDATLD